MTASVDDQQATGAPASRSRRTVLAVAAAVALLMVAALAFALGGSDDEQAVSLSLPGGGAMSSCVVFDEAILANMPLAFDGTVTAVADRTVTLQVERWYRSGPDGEAPVVEVDLPDAMTSAVLDGIELREGGRYLVTATDGVVNGCGFTGTWSADLAASFGRAFS